MICLKNGLIFKNGNLVKEDLYVKDDKIVKYNGEKITKVIDINENIIIPSGTDIHVHLREPGFEGKETIETASASALKGGFTTLFAMPNVIPYPDDVKDFKYSLELISKKAKCEIYPFACITKEEKGKELVDIDALSEYALAFSDDGVGIDDMDLMREACEKVSKNHKVICSHAEVKEKKYTREGEYEAVKREIEIAKNFGLKYHFCHLSTVESFLYVKQAKEAGMKLTCEVCPHHLFLDEDDINNDPNFKMNPPLRTKADKEATINALLSGVASIVASDHAPHKKEEKTLPYEKALNGIIGLETTIPLLYTNLIKTNKATIKDLVSWIHINPRNLMGLKVNNLDYEDEATFIVLDVNNYHVYSEKEILSKSKNTPFIGHNLTGYVKYTFLKGQLVYEVNYEG